MKALVTGSAGFVGRHMVAELQRRDWDLTGCDPLGWDRRDALDRFRIDGNVYDLVVHAAAREPHRAAIDGKPGGFPYNVMLDSAMFDWAIRTGQHRVLYLSSSAAYPVDLQRRRPKSAEPIRLCEDYIELGEPWITYMPDASYGWAKLTGEMMAAAARTAGLPVTVVRPFSGYGEDQSEDFPFGAFAARARRREDPFPLWNADAVRDWTHIDDVVAGALAVVDSGTDEPVNLCTGRGESCGDVAAAIARASGYSPEFQTQGDKPAGVAYRVGDPTRLHQYYKPQVTLEEGIARALAA